MTKSNTQTRSLARLLAVQALFEIEASRRPFADVVNEIAEIDLSSLMDADVEPAKIDQKLTKTLVYDAIHNQIKIDQTTNTILKENWPLAKIDPILRAVFRAAGAEMIASSTPPKVVINEYLDVTKAFDDQKETIAFVNAILDRLSAQLRS